MNDNSSGELYRDRIRAAVIIPREDSLLLLSYCFNGETFWSLPGGAPLSGESPEKAARREVQEETDLDVQDLRFLFMSDHTYRSGIGIDSGGPGGWYHELGIYFVADRFSGDIRLGDEPEHGGGAIRSAAFLPFPHLNTLRFYPSHLIQPILNAAAEQFRLPPFYLEDRSLRDWIAPLL